MAGAARAATTRERQRCTGSEAFRPSTTGAEMQAISEGFARRANRPFLVAFFAVRSIARVGAFDPATHCPQSSVAAYGADHRHAASFPGRRTSFSARKTRSGEHGTLRGEPSAVLQRPALLRYAMYLPDDLWMAVLRQVDDHVALCAAATACRQLRRLAASQCLWQRLCLSLPSSETPACDDWRALYERVTVKLRRDRLAARERRCLFARSAVNECVTSIISLTSTLSRELVKRAELEGALGRLRVAAAPQLEAQDSHWLPRACRARDDAERASPWERERLLQALHECRSSASTLSLSLRRREGELRDLTEALRVAETSLP